MGEKLSLFSTRKYIYFACCEEKCYGYNRETVVRNHFNLTVKMVRIASMIIRKNSKYELNYVSVF